MNEFSDHVSYRVNASLPYPLRLEGGPFSIIGNLGKANLSFETVRQTTYDTRLLIESGEFDFYRRTTLITYSDEGKSADLGI